MTYYTIEYDKVVAYEGYYDPLRGTVVQRPAIQLTCAELAYLQHDSLVRGKGTWETEGEAWEALVELAIREFKATRNRMKLVKRQYQKFKKTKPPKEVTGQ